MDMKGIDVVQSRLYGRQAAQSKLRKGVKTVSKCKCLFIPFQALQNYSNENIFLFPYQFSRC